MITVESWERVDKHGKVYRMRVDQMYGGQLYYYIDDTKVTSGVYNSTIRRTKSYAELDALRYRWIRDKATHEQLDRMIVLESKDVDAWVDERCKPWGG